MQKYLSHWKIRVRSVAISISGWQPSHTIFLGNEHAKIDIWTKLNKLSEKKTVQCRTMINPLNRTHKTSHLCRGLDGPFLSGGDTPPRSPPDRQKVHPVLPPAPGGTFQHFQMGNYALKTAQNARNRAQNGPKNARIGQIFLKKVLPPAPPQTAKNSPPERGGLWGGVAPPQPISCGGENPPQNKSPPRSGGESLPL